MEGHVWSDVCWTRSLEQLAKCAAGAAGKVRTTVQQRNHTFPPFPNLRVQPGYQVALNAPVKITNIRNSPSLQRTQKNVPGFPSAILQNPVRTTKEANSTPTASF